jgi:hypothetical protein
MSALPVAACLPLKTSGLHYGENIERMRLMLDSFELFLDFPERLPVFAICVASEMAAARDAFGRYRKIELVFVPEEEVVPGIGAHRAIGWYKQQALKLAFAQAGPAPFCLTLDPDILLCRRLRVTDLVADGRCFTSWMSKAEHPHWWAASADILGVGVDPSRPGLNVTPQMLAREVAHGLGTHLALRLGAGDPWLALLDVAKSWTEYTLYALYAESSGLLERYHRPDLPGGRRLLGRSVWKPENFSNYSLVDIHRDAAGAFFTVCASHTNVSAGTLRGMFGDLAGSLVTA